ncbi:MAG TPA: VanZ family protein, partial [Candidatus Tectomicrobia bacterium]|nr:VanZ family protein [Candidatus Tectomicrobia bacterium]
MRLPEAARRLGSWLAPCAWMGVILWLSTGDFSADATGGLLVPLFRWLLPWTTDQDLAWLHGLARKAAHVAVYAILAALWFRAVRRETRLGDGAASWIALGVALAWAVVDEAHQATLPTRTGSAVDVAIDGAGAVLALL